jgi:hypothetical protein
MACSSSIFGDGFYAELFFIDQALVRCYSQFSPETPANIRPYDFYLSKSNRKCSPEGATRIPGFSMRDDRPVMRFASYGLQRYAR